MTTDTFAWLVPAESAGEHAEPAAIFDELWADYPLDVVAPMPDTSLPWGERVLELLHEPVDEPEPEPIEATQLLGLIDAENGASA